LARPFRPPGLAGCKDGLAPGLFGKRGRQVYFRIRWISHATSRWSSTRHFPDLLAIPSSLKGADFIVCQQLSLQRRLSNRRRAPESHIAAYGAKLRVVRLFRMRVDWQ